ncbi:DUF1643 domain-containing protein [Bacillus cereus]|uniref:DUF1643 domain-containing protein n=1 Tax=Bacillus cereus TaxID=1396 RepID=UPI000BF371E3|nr:DUF1643 domain-containing protein [Bacillus cereus]PFR33803.1 hypothetical protein COK20_26995 [Bacillus cereus]
MEMKNFFQAIEGFIKLPEDVTELQFYEELKEWIENRGGEYLKESICLPQGLEVQRAQHLAIFDKSKENRYTLRINWDPNKNKVAVLMMNPSHATALNSDDTVKFMVPYVIRYFDAGSIWIVNMSPFIEPDSLKVDATKFTSDKENMNFIEQAIKWSDIAFLSWGDNGGNGVRAFGNWFKNLMETNKEKLRCFKQSKAGNPIHRHQRPPIQLDWQPQKVDLKKLFRV